MAAAAAALVVSLWLTVQAQQKADPSIRINGERSRWCRYWAERPGSRGLGYRGKPRTFRRNLQRSSSRTIEGDTSSRIFPKRPIRSGCAVYGLIDSPKVQTPQGKMLTSLQWLRRLLRRRRNTIHRCTGFRS